MTTEQTKSAKKTRTVPLYFDVFVVLASAMFGVVYGSYYKFPGNVLGPIGGLLTGLGWCYLIRLFLKSKKACPAIIAGLIMGILAGVIATFIINVPVFFGIHPEAGYCDTYLASGGRGLFHDVALISSPFVYFFAADNPEDYITKAFWTGGVMGGYLGLIGGVLYGLANKYQRRMTESKYWPKPRMDMFYCVATAVAFGFLLMSISHYRIKPYFFITFPTVLILFTGWVLLKRFVCRTINLWPFFGVLPIYIIDNACLILICYFIFARRFNEKVVFGSMIYGGTWGLVWGLIFAINKKIFDRGKSKNIEAVDG